MKWERCDDILTQMNLIAILRKDNFLFVSHRQCQIVVAELQQLHLFVLEITKIESLDKIMRFKILLKESTEFKPNLLSQSFSDPRWVSGVFRGTENKQVLESLWGYFWMAFEDHFPS